MSTGSKMVAFSGCYGMTNTTEYPIKPYALPIRKTPDTPLYPRSGRSLYIRAPEPTHNRAHTGGARRALGAVRVHMITAASRTSPITVNECQADILKQSTSPPIAAVPKAGRSVDSTARTWARVADGQRGIGLILALLASGQAQKTGLGDRSGVRIVPGQVASP